MRGWEGGKMFKNKQISDAGIVGYGTYIPVRRLKLSDIAEVWKKNPKEITSSLQVYEKSVPAIDEDAVTIALEAAFSAIKTADIKSKDIGVLFVGSESHPYAVNPTSTIVGELLDIGHDYLASDLEFACKAGSAGIQAALGLILSGQVGYGLAIGSDTAQSQPHDVLEYTSASAGAAYLLGRENLAVRVIGFTSYSSDTPDFWRRDGIRFPTHAGRFTGEPAYFTHVLGASRKLLNDFNFKPEDFDYCVFHMPNGKFPRDVARRLGFSKSQLLPSLIIDSIGNPYSASSLLGLAAVLDIAGPKQKIFMASYGSGAGSDAFIFETTKKISDIQKRRKEMTCRVSDHIERKCYISYSEYLKNTHKI